MLSTETVYSFDLGILIISLVILVLGVWLSLPGNPVLKRARSFAFLFKGIQIIDEGYIKVCIRKRNITGRSDVCFAWLRLAEANPENVLGQRQILHGVDPR
jgi:hypothetical protein